MNEYEYDIKIWKLILLWNCFAIVVVLIGVIFTNSLWWLLMMLTYKTRDNKEES